MRQRRHEMVQPYITHAVIMHLAAGCCELILNVGMWDPSCEMSEMASSQADGSLVRFKV